MKKIGISASIILLVSLAPITVLSETIDVLIKGVDDGVKTSKQQDYKEAEMNAKLQAIERAGVRIESMTRIVNFQMKYKAVESKAKAVLLPGFQVMDMGYQVDGSYQVVLSGKVTVGKAKPQKSPKSLLNMATREEIKGNKHYSEHRYDEAKVHYKKALQLYNNILKSFPGSDEALKIERESIVEKLKAGEMDRDGPFIAYNNGTVKDTRTGLMWASKDNGKNITWNGAKRYCENYRGGGYTNWRIPTQDELASLYDPNKENRHGYHVTKLIDISACCPWASETRGSEAAFFGFHDGYRDWPRQSYSYGYRALPVRAGN